jgi:integrase
VAHKVDKKPAFNATSEVRNMNQLPFTVFKKGQRRFYYVRFKDEQTGKHLSSISTKKETKTEAIQTAFDWLRNGIPQKGEVIDFKKYTLRDMAKEADISKSDAEYICKELQRRNLLKSYILEDSIKAIDFMTYLIDFWDWEKSSYIKEKLRKNHGLHKRYTIENSGIIKKYWEPFFSGKLLGEITRHDIESFILYLESLQEKAEKEQAEIDKALQEEGNQKLKRRIIRFPKSATRKNTIIQAGTIPLSWAFQKELIEKDITTGIIWFSGKAKERQIVTPDLAKALFAIKWKDDRSRLANMLAMVTGMRAGEIQGLQIQDFGKDCLYVRHSWNFQDGLKTTKNNESRIVEVPFSGLMQELMELAKSNPHGYDMNSFIFWAEKFPNKPIEQDIFRRDLKVSLKKIGLSDDIIKAYTFHGWRHYFTSYMKPQIDEKLLRSQTGHKTPAMLDHYAGHRIAGDRERIQKAQIETFGDLIPCNAGHSFDSASIFA